MKRADFIEKWKKEQADAWALFEVARKMGCEEQAIESASRGRTIFEVLEDFESIEDESKEDVHG